MARIIVAIDPGKKGAISYFVNGELKNVRIIPLIGKDTIDKVALKDMLKPHSIVMAYTTMTQRNEDSPTVEYVIEKVQVNWMGGKKQVAEARGNIEFLSGLLTAFELPIHEVAPSAWQKVAWQGTTPLKKSDGKVDTKATSFMALQKLYPTWIETVRIKAKPGFHDGMVDSIMIGYYAILSY